MDSSPTNATDLLPGQSPPLTIITPTDQSGIVLIATALSLIFALLSMLIRAFVRLQLRNEFGRDDILATLAMIFSVVQSSVVFVQISRGLGQTITNISATDLVQLQKALYTGDIFYVVALWLTKCAAACLFLRLSPKKNHVMASNITLLAVAVLMVISVFIVALRCNLAYPWIFINEQCPNLFLRWQVVTAFDTITEVALFCTSIYLLYSLQLALKRKLMVIMAFGLRLPVIAAAVIRLYYLSREFSSSDPTLDGVLASVCTQIEICYAIIAVTIPCLRPFMSALSTNYGGPSATKPKSSRSPSATQSGRSNRQFSLASLPKMAGAGRSEWSTECMSAAPTNRWDQTENQTTVTAGDKPSMESHGSKQMIISKDVGWDIEYQNT